jgi:hypothetical protein
VQRQRLLDAMRRIRARGGVLGHSFRSGWLWVKPALSQAEPRHRSGKVGQDG